MTLPPFVFLGPSCSVHDAQQVVDAVFAAPAQRGDIVRAVSSGYRRIVLIDGQMVHGYSPSPNEILSALKAGVTVYGASSLGALRAVELRNHGMSGFGWVYRQFLSGTIFADDELVTLMWPDTWAPLNVPLVCLRYSVHAVLSGDSTAREQGSELLGRVKRLYYEDRTRTKIASIAAEIGISKHVTEELFAQEHDIKRKDALECLTAMSRLQ